MANDASAALGAPQLAGTLVNPRGYAKNTVARVAGAEVAGLAGTVAAGIATRGGGAATPDLPDFGRVGYVAVSATEVVVVRTKTGLLKMSPTDIALARAPRSELVSAELDEGKLLSHLVIRLADGKRWEFDVPKANKKTAKEVVATLAAAG
jgi:hypothetical protein